MKKIVVLLISLVVFSCSIEDDSIQDYQVSVPIESANLPEQFMLDESYEISVNYIRSTNCHAFNDILLLNENNEVKIVVTNTVFQSNGNCSELEEELEATFNFTATQTDPYIFKFWQGKSENGEDIFLTVEVPVVN